METPTAVEPGTMQDTNANQLRCAQELRQYLESIPRADVVAMAWAILQSPLGAMKNVGRTKGNAIVMLLAEICDPKPVPGKTSTINTAAVRLLCSLIKDADEGRISEERLGYLEGLILGAKSPQTTCPTVAEQRAQALKFKEECRLRDERLAQRQAQFDSYQAACLEIAKKWPLPERMGIKNWDRSCFSIDILANTEDPYGPAVSLGLRSLDSWRLESEEPRYCVEVSWPSLSDKRLSTARRMALALGIGVEMTDAFEAAGREMGLNITEA